MNGSNYKLKQHLFAKLPEQNLTKMQLKLELKTETYIKLLENHYKLKLYWIKNLHAP